MIVGKVNMRYVAFVAVVAAVGGFLFGYDTAVISGTIDTVARQFSLDALHKGRNVRHIYTSPSPRDA